MNYKELGFRSDNFKECLFPYTLFTLVISFVTFFVVQVLNITPLLWPLWKTLYRNNVMLVIWIAFLQELVFRGILLTWMKKKLKPPIQVIVCNALLFSIVHVMFPYKAILVPGSFLLGLGFATMFYFYPNLWLISLSHAMLNLVVLPMCAFNLIHCWIR